MRIQPTLAFVVLFSIWKSVDCQQLPVSLRPKLEYVVVRGDDAALSCAAQDETASIKLYKVEGSILTEIVQGGRFSVSLPPGDFGIRTLSCTIKPVESSDAGLYTCKATAGSKSGSANTTLIVDVPPSGILVSVRSSSYVVSEGTPFTINCSADAAVSPTPTITLRHGGSIVGNATGHELLYTIASAGNSDEGNYTCNVGNRQGNITEGLSRLIDVQAPAKIDRFVSVSNPPSNDVVEIEEGKDERLECTASGDPVLTVQLRDESKSLNSSTNVNTITVELKSVQVGQDNGSYYCSASNAVGVSEKNLQVIVYKRPVITKFDDGTRCIVNGLSDSVECVSEGDPLPTVNITNSTGESMAEGRGVATFSFKAEENLNGEYKCSAKNEYDEDTKIFSLCIARQPDVPTNLDINDASGPGQLSFSWTASSCGCFCGCFPVTNHTLVCSGGGSSVVDSSIPSPSTSQSVSESLFTPSVNYSCSVSGINEVGSSGLSNPFLIQKPDGSPGTPSLKIGSPKGRSAVVQWTPIPKANQFGVIRNYTIYVTCITGANCASNPSSTFHSTTLEQDITGLHPTTQYGVVVSGVNVIGEGPKSATFTFTTTFAAPSLPPSDVKISPETIFSTNFSIEWKEIPIGAQNALISEYTVYVECVTSSECSPPIGPKTVDHPLLSTVISNLRPDTMYTVTVTGSNVGGESPKSSPITIATKEGVPTSVRNLTATPNSDSSVNVSWIEPIALNGKLTHYEISYSPNGGMLNSSNMHILVANLNDQEYTFTVRAITGGGTSPLLSVKERPSVSPKVSGNADATLPYKGSVSVTCNFRRYPAPPIPTLKRSGVDLTSSAIIIDRPSQPPYTQRLTYRTTQVRTFSCEFDGVEDTVEVTAPAQIINSTTTGVKYVDSPVTIFVEGRQYPGIPSISCTDSSDSLFDTTQSSFQQLDGANYRRLTFEVSKATTLTCSITGSDAPVTIEITSDDEKGPILFLSKPLYDYLAIGGIAIGGVLLLILLIFAFCCCCCAAKLPRCCNTCYECCCCSEDSADNAILKSKPKRLSSPRIYGRDGVATDEFGYEDVAYTSEGLAATTFKPGAPQARPNEYDAVAGDFPPADASGNGAYETIGKNHKLITKAVANAQHKSSSPPSDFDGEEEEGPYAVGGGREPKDAWNPPETSLVIQNPAETSPPPDDQAYSQVEKKKKRKSSRKSSKNADRPPPPPPSGDTAYAVVDKARKHSKSRSGHMEVGGDEYALVEMKGKKPPPQDLQYASIDHTKPDSIVPRYPADYPIDYSEIRPPSGVLQDEL